MYEDLAEMTKSASKGKEEEKEKLGAEKEEVGLTFDRLATIVRMAKELRQVAQEWDASFVAVLKYNWELHAGL